MKHIIPSGMKKSLCGKENVQGDSLGFGCDCEECLNYGQKIIDNKDGKNE